ncbi:MAG: hypothetical protein K0S77_2950 [Pseudomonas sp.]|jgi:hypothetical protein|nr:hypothetical protein [Pseudomonas sp.]
MAKADDSTTWTPSEIDTIEDRMGSVHELDFNDSDEHEGRAGDLRDPREVAHEFPAERVAESGMTGGEALSDTVQEDGVTLDDMSPGTLLDETGARDPDELGSGRPADQTLTHVDAEEIGGGFGLDEAELARSNPLDGKPWTDDVVDTDDTERN